MRTHKTYDVPYRRDGEFWIIEIPELNGFTQALSINEVELMAKDWIEARLNAPADTFSVVLGRS